MIDYAAIGKRIQKKRQERSITQEKLAEQGIRAAVRKLPPELMRSCGYALYLLSSSIQSVVAVLSENEIDFRGAYEITNIDGSSTYKRVV